MSFAQKFVPSFFLKQDPLRKELKKINLYTDDLLQTCLNKGMQIFHRNQKQQREEQILKSVMKLMQQKTTHVRKLKLFCFLIQISKETKYDVADILITKKLKIFTKCSTKVKLLIPLDKNTLEHYILADLLIPLYNYLMKLSLNEELFNTCLSMEIPHDEIFRRGMKIRFIWIFKIYNLIHIVIPILESTIRFIKAFPNFKFLLQMGLIFYQDLIVMNNFVIKALEQASNDNYILMPYFDMLQFYESLTQQLETIKKINNIHSELHKSIKKLQKPQELNLTAQQISEIEVQALRVKLISNSLKNPKKDHTRLETEYNVKSQIRQKVHRRQAAMTQGNQKIEEQQNEDIQSFRQKYKNLDIGKKKDLSLSEVSDQDQMEQQFQNQEIDQQK